MKQVRLAFSGSGFLAPIHAGAACAFLDAGVQIVEVAGTSGGSIAAALIAAVAVIVSIAHANGADRTPTTNAMAADAGQADAPGDDVHNFVGQLRERVRRNPEDDDGWYQLGLAYRQIGQYEEAEQAFRRAMQLRPNNADYVAFLGETVLLRGVNDDPAVLSELFRGLVRLRARPYYLLQADPVRGTGHLRTPLARSIAICTLIPTESSGSTRYAPPTLGASAKSAS